MPKRRYTIDDLNGLLALYRRGFWDLDELHERGWVRCGFDGDGGLCELIDHTAMLDALHAMPKLEMELRLAGLTDPIPEL